VILGGSGSGKSVTIKCVLGLIEPDAGVIEIDGRDVLRMSRRERQEIADRIGMLFQNGALFDSLPVWENVCFKLLAQNRITRAAARDRAAEVLEQVGLASSVGDLSPAELSGGMQKRVALARAVAARPEIVFFDEPTTGLDPIMGSVIDGLIADVVKRLGRDGALHHPRHSQRPAHRRHGGDDPQGPHRLDRPGGQPGPHRQSDGGPVRTGASAKGRSRWSCGDKERLAPNAHCASHDQSHRAAVRLECRRRDSLEVCWRLGYPALLVRDAGRGRRRGSGRVPRPARLRDAGRHAAAGRPRMALGSCIVHVESMVKDGETLA
jgi:ABC-type lipoprotein export system ATPase subunit